jgi:hypothetical protein
VVGGGWLVVVLVDVVGALAELGEPDERTAGVTAPEHAVSVNATRASTPTATRLTEGLRCVHRSHMDHVEGVALVVTERRGLRRRPASDAER